MGRFAFKKRDFLVLFGFAWAAVLVYCGYLLILRVQDIRREAIIDANRTPNDIVIDNAELVYSALLESSNDNNGKISRDLKQLVNAGHLKHVPINPFTGQEVEFIRIGMIPNAGNFSVVTGWVEAGQDGDSEPSKHEDLIIVAYGQPEVGFSKYADNRIVSWNNCNTLFGPRLPIEVDNHVIYLNGQLGGPGGKVSAGYFVRRQTLEEAMLDEGYSLPIQIEHATDDARTD